MLVLTRMAKTEPEFVIDWSTSSDSDIVRALEMHYSGKIDLHNYWSVGDERTIHLSAIPEDSNLGLGDSHVAQDITMVLLNAGGKMLADGETECAFVVGQKYVLYNPNTLQLENGYMFNSSATHNYVGWERAERRTWCNNNYYEAFPTSIRSIFKEHINMTDGDTNGDEYAQTIDKFELPCEKEYFGTTEFCRSSSNKLESTMPYLQHYWDVLNLDKLPPTITGNESSNDAWWFYLRTSGYSAKNYNANDEYVAYNDRCEKEYHDGYSLISVYGNKGTKRGIAPQGCI